MPACVKFFRNPLMDPVTQTLILPNSDRWNDLVEECGEPYYTDGHLSNAIHQQSREWIDFLIGNGISPGHIHLHNSITAGNYDIFQRIYTAAKDPVINHSKLLNIAALYGQLEIFKFLHHVDPKIADHYTSLEAVDGGNLDVVKYLIEEVKLDPTVHQNELFRMAASEGHLDIVRYLLELPGVNPAAKNNYAIRYATANNHVGVMYELLQIMSVDPTVKRNQAVCMAAGQGSLEAIKYLIDLQEYFPLNLMDRNNCALILASSRGYTEVVRLLLQSGVDPSVPDNKAIISAAWTGRSDVVRLLADHLPFVPVEALNEAATNGKLEVVKILYPQYVTDTTEAIRLAKINRNSDIVSYLRQ